MYFEKLLKNSLLQRFLLLDSTRVSCEEGVKESRVLLAKIILKIFFKKNYRITFENC